MRILCLVSVLGFVGCVHVSTDPIQVEPIHVTVDVHVKVDRALDEFFEDLDDSSGTLEP